MRIFPSLLPGLAMVLAPVMASAVSWPGAAPCNTTLQACIDATPNGGTVLIETDTPVAESINLYNRSLTLAGGSSRRAALAPGNWISVTSASIAGDQAVTLRNLHLTNAYVRAVYLGVGTATFDFSGLDLRQDNTAPTYIRVEGRTGNTVQARLYDNRITAVPANVNAGSIELAGNGGTLQAQVYYNQVRSRSEVPVDGAGIFADISGGGGTLKLHGNTVRGGYTRAALFISEGQASSTASSFAARLYNNVVVCAATPGTSGSTGTGISFTAYNGSIDAQAINNTLTRCDYGINANQWFGGGASADIRGLVKNNLIVGTRGLTFTPAITGSLANDYNLLNVSGNLATLGPNTITANARLIATTAPRLSAGSPAIDAADTSTLGLGIILNTLPTNDADGLRRIKGAASSAADIGAYEYGDGGLLHVVNSGNTVASYITRIDSPQLDGQSAASPLATPHWNGSGAGVTNDTPQGIYYSGGQWLLFNQDRTTPMPANAAFNVFVPAAGSGSFRHVSSAANTAGYATRMDNGALNNLPDHIVLVMQNWSAGASVYNAHPVGVSYSADRWHIVNIDLTGSGMPLDAGFNVYAQQASPNAFRVTGGGGGSNSITLDHPLLNDTACARPQVTRLHSGNSVARNFDVYYGGGSGRWSIYSYTPLPTGSQFHVLIDPAQVYACTDLIFASGME